MTWRIQVVRVITLFSWVCVFLRFKGTTILRRVRNHCSCDTASHPGRPETYNMQYMFSLCHILILYHVPPTSYPSDIDRSLKLDPNMSANCCSSAAGRLHSTAEPLGQGQWRWEILCCRKSYSCLPLSCRIRVSPIIYLFLLVLCHIHLVNLILLLCCTLHGRFCMFLRKFPFYLLDALEKMHHQPACKNHKNKNNTCNTRKSRFQLVASLKNGLKS